MDKLDLSVLGFSDEEKLEKLLNLLHSPPESAEDRVKLVDIYLSIKRLPVDQLPAKGYVSELELYDRVVNMLKQPLGRREPHPAVPPRVTFVDQISAKFHPETWAAVLQFFLPKKIRKEVFEPYTEELKEDRLLKKAAKHGKFASFLIELGFFTRLLITFLHAWLLWIASMIAKLSPLLKWFIGGA